MKNTVFVIVAVLSLFTSGSYVHAAGLKKVLVLDIKNIDKDGSYQYLEASITDATRKLLKKRFVFKDADKPVVLRIAKDNYIHPDDFYTYTAALNLGLLTQQDIVIAGGYNLKQIAKTTEDTEEKTKKGKIKKKTSYSTRLYVFVRIYDISKRQMIAEIKEQTPVDSSLFSAVDRIAGRIADEARNVLPNAEQWQKMGIPLESPVALNQLTILGGLSFNAIPSTPGSEISSSTVVYPEQIKQNNCSYLTPRGATNPNH